MANQTGRYSEAELALIKSTFGNKELLRAIQKVIYQTPLTAVEQSLLQVNLSPEVCKILRKMFLPDLKDDVPFDQVWDLTGSINFKERIAEDIVHHIKANALVIKYFNQQIKSLEEKNFTKKGRISFEKLIDTKKENNQIFINHLARANIMGTTIGRLTALKGLAETKEETEEEKNNRLLKDSTK